MASFRKENSIKIFAILVAVIATLSVLFAFAPNFNAVASSDVDAFYAENKDNETLIKLDKNSGLFEYHYEMCCALGDDSHYEIMQAMVDIANEIDSSYASFDKSLYSASSYSQITQIFDDLKDDCVFESGFALADKAKYLSKITSATKSAKSVKKIRQEYSDYVSSEKERLNQLKDSFLAVNKAKPNGSVESVVGYYDQTAVSEIESIYSQANTDILGVLFDDVTKFDEYCSQVKAIVDGASVSFQGVAKNDIERTIDLYNDYLAITNGLLEGDKEQAYSLLESSAQKVGAEGALISNLSDDVRKNYSNEISLIKTFLKEDFQEPIVDLEPISQVKTEDGVIVITALKDGQPINVFPKQAYVVANNSANGSAKANALREIKAIDKNLGVAYCIYIDVFNGSSVWDTASVSDEGVYYQVAIDLNEYFKSYVNNYDFGLLESLLKNVGSLQAKFASENKYDQIIDADKYVKEQSDKTGYSVVYRYYKNDEGVRCVDALNYTIDGGKLMFETTNFSTFLAATSNNGGLSIWWIILIAVLVAILLVALIIIIVKNCKYKFVFITDGGSKVKTIKAKKDESFAMPNPPVKDGYVFGGWFNDKECTVRFIDTNVKKRKTTKVYAKWYEKTIPDKFVKYFEKLRNEISAYAKVGPLANMGLEENEVLARLFADTEGVYLYVGLGFRYLKNAGYDIEDASEDYEDTPAKLSVYNKENCRDAMSLVRLLMAKKGLQNVGLADEPLPMTIEEREKGFTFEIENDRVAVSASDYYEMLRLYSKSFALYSPKSGVEEGDVLLRMYLDEEVVKLYLALPVSGVLEESDRFEDTPALFNVEKTAKDYQKACNYIDRVMASNGYSKRNESSNSFKLQRVEKGCGSAFVVSFDN